MKGLFPGSAAFTPLQRGRSRGHRFISGFWSIVSRSGVNAALHQPRLGLGVSLTLAKILAFVPANAATTAADERNIPKLAPPYPELPPTFWELHAGVITVTGIVLLALAALGIWLGLRKKAIEIVPPEVLVRNELKALQELPEDGAVLSKVSQAVRRYFIAAFVLPSGEFTTMEFCRIISGNEKIGAELSVAVAEFLQDCDGRKFSAASVAPSGTVARALDLVERSETHRRPAPPANP